MYIMFNLIGHNKSYLDLFGFELIVDKTIEMFVHSSKTKVIFVKDSNIVLTAANIKSYTLQTLQGGHFLRVISKPSVFIFLYWENLHNYLIHNGP